MVFEAIFIDLDDTLYPSSSGLWGLIRERIDIYLHDNMGFSWEIIPETRHKLFSEYGTTMRGLQKLYGIDVKEYLKFVHNVPVSKLIKPNPGLKEFFQSLSFSKFIFTNADSQHAQRVLQAMQLEEEINGIIDILAMEPFCKPQLPAFQAALKISGNPDPRRCILIDDYAKNIEVAKSLGFWTVLVQEGREKDPNQTTIQNVGEFEQVFEEWEAIPAP